MNLLDTQRAFSAQLQNHDDDFVACAPGIEVYRNAYRARLVEALRIGFDRTWAWVGDEAFTAAAAHHIIDTPPSSWTLDDYGSTFPDTLTTLFAEDREVGELAWLEWHMQRAFAAEDTPVFDAAAFTAMLDEVGGSESLCFQLVANFCTRTLHTNCTAIWLALADNAASPPAAAQFDEATHLIVWRKGFAPHFRVLDGDEFAALSALASGERFGDLCASAAARWNADEAATRVGAWLGQWIGDGLIAGARRTTTMDASTP